MTSQRKRRKGEAVAHRSDSTAADALAQLRLYAQGIASPTYPIGRSQQPPARVAVSGGQSASSSEPNTPFLLQRLAGLNGASYLQAASELRASGERCHHRAGSNVHDSHRNEEENEESPPWSTRQRLQAPSPIGGMAAYSENEEAGSIPRPRSRASELPVNRGTEQQQQQQVVWSAPAPIGEGAAAIHRAVAKALAPARPAPKQNARRQPRAPARQPAVKKPALAANTRAQNGMGSPAGTSVRHSFSNASQGAGGGSPTWSTGSSTYGRLTSPQRGQAKEVESYLMRAARMTEPNATAPQHGGHSSIHVPLNAPPIGVQPQSHAGQFDTPSWGGEPGVYHQPVGGGNATRTTLSAMRAATAAVPPGTATMASAPSYETPRASHHPYHILSQGHRCPTRQSMSFGGIGASLMQVPYGSPPAQPSAVSAMRGSAHGSMGPLAGSQAVGTSGSGMQAMGVSGVSGVLGYSARRLVVMDTSSLIDSDPAVLNLMTERWTLCVPYTVLDELDNIHKGKAGTAGAMGNNKRSDAVEWIRKRARELRDWIAAALNRKNDGVRVQKRTEVLDGYIRTSSNKDDDILGFAVYLKNRGERHITFVSEDKFLRVKAQSEIGESYSYKDLKKWMGVRH